MPWWAMPRGGASGLLLAAVFSFVAVTSEAMPTDLTSTVSADKETEGPFWKDTVAPQTNLLLRGGVAWLSRRKRSADSTGTAGGTYEQTTTPLPTGTPTPKFALSGHNEPTPAVHRQQSSHSKSHDESASVNPHGAVLESSSRKTSTEDVSDAPSLPAAGSDDSDDVAPLQPEARADESARAVEGGVSARTTTAVHSDPRVHPVDIDINPQGRVGDENPADASRPVAASEKAVVSVTPVSEEKVSESTYPTTAPAKRLPEANEGKSVPESEADHRDVAASAKKGETDGRREDPSISASAQAQTSERGDEKRSRIQNAQGEEAIASGHSSKIKETAAIAIARDDHAGSGSGDHTDLVKESGQPGVIPANLQAPRTEGAQGEAFSPAQLARLMGSGGLNPDTPKDSVPQETGRSGADQVPATSGSARATKNEGERAVSQQGAASSKSGDAPATGSDQPREDISGTSGPIAGNPGTARTANATPLGQAGNVPVNLPGQLRTDVPKASDQAKPIGTVLRTEGDQKTGRSQGAPEGLQNKPQEVPRNADGPASPTTNNDGQPASPRVEQAKPQQGQTASIDGGKGVVGREDDSKKPEGGRGEPVRQGDAPTKLQEVPRAGDSPAASATNNGGQPASPRAEQPKTQLGQAASVDGGREDDSAKPEGGRGEAVRQGDVPTKPQEVPRAADSPAASATNNGGQPASPRAEQPKPQQVQAASVDGGKGVVGREDDSPKPEGGRGEAVRQGDVPTKPQEVPRAADSPATSATNNGGQPASARAEQPKPQQGQVASVDGGKGVVGREDDSANPEGGRGEAVRQGDVPSKPQEVPRATDSLAASASNSGGQPASPRAEQPKPLQGQAASVDGGKGVVGREDDSANPEGGRGEAVRQGDVPSKPQEVPRATDSLAASASNSGGQPASPRAEQPKPQQGQAASVDGGKGVVGREDDSPKPEGGRGEAVRQGDGPTKPQEVPRAADSPAASATNNGGQPASPRAEQPKPQQGQVASVDGGKGVVGREDDSAKPEGGRGEAVRQGDVPTKPQEVPRATDSLAASASNSGGQPASPRAERPKPQQGQAASVDGGKGVVGREDDSPKPEGGRGEAVRQGDAPTKPQEVPRAADSPAASNTNNGGQPASPRAGQPKTQQGQAASVDGGKGVAGREGDSMKPEGGRGDAVRQGGAPTKPQEVPRTADGPAAATTNNGGQPAAPRAEKSEPEQGQKGTSGSSSVPRAEQSVPVGVNTPTAGWPNGGQAASRSDEDGREDTIPAKSQEGGRTDHGKTKTVVAEDGDETVAITVPKDSAEEVIVEGEKETEHPDKKDEPIKTLETTESETHISVDDTTPDKIVKPVVIETKEPSKQKKHKDSVPEIEIRNVTIEVEPAPDEKPEKKPEHIVPVAPSAQDVMYPTPVVTDHPYPQQPQHTVYQPYQTYQPHPPYQAYQPHQPQQSYQPYQMPAYHQPEQVVVYNPQYPPSYHHIHPTGYVPSAPLPYLPSQHGHLVQQAPSNYGSYQQPPHQPHYHQQPYATYRPAQYHPVYQQGYYSPNGHNYAAAPYTTHHPVYNHQPPVMQLTAHQPAIQHGNPPGYYGHNAANYHVIYPPRYGPPHKPRQMRSYRPTHPVAAQIHHSIPQRQNFHPSRRVPAYRVQQPPVAHVRHPAPVAKAPKLQPMPHGGYKRHLSEENPESPFHFAPTVIGSSKGTDHAASDNHNSAPQAVKMNNIRSHPMHGKLAKKEPTPVHGSINSFVKPPPYVQPMIPAIYWRSADGVETSTEESDQPWAYHQDSEEYAATESQPY